MVKGIGSKLLAPPSWAEIREGGRRRRLRQGRERSMVRHSRHWRHWRHGRHGRAPGSSSDRGRAWNERNDG